MTAYINSKRHVYRWQGASDVAVFNADHATTRAMARTAPGNVMFFSSVRSRANPGTYVKNGYIMYRRGKRVSRIIGIKQLLLPGGHNLSNILAALAVAELYGVDRKSVV